ncbi:molecular chaperone [Aquisalimonas sp.]|uniref:TorD/DmsD family molecular chaperone n=1 Tax=Aquisalimonas sp. TaxID=1872621 RepID=UPI0025B9E7EA|nr:molecular chaperone TorD family protein [Aquisalimonas sp.]
MGTKHESASTSHAATREDEFRAGTWTLLGRLLATSPDETVLGLLRQIPGIEQGRDADALAAAWRELRAGAEQADLELLKREFHELFIGVGGGELTPYASWYLTGSLMERPLVVLRQDLQQLGVERLEGNSEPEDHAAAICDVMALVISDPDVSFEWQREIFQKHVEPWMGQFFHDLEHAENAEFYTAVGRVGVAFVALEQDYFSMLA